MRYEICRHAAILDGGGSITQETRHWHEDTGVTTSGREKSGRRGLPVLPRARPRAVAPTRETVEALKKTLPEPPAQRRKRLQADWGFSDLEMRDVVNAGAVELIEESVEAGATPAGARKWWTGSWPVAATPRARASTSSASRRSTSPSSTAWSATAGSTTTWLARSSTASSPARAARSRWPTRAASSWCRTTTPSAVDKVIEANPDVAEKVRGGKVQAAGALIGQVMKEMKGQADAGKARQIILERLAS